ncbi:MAG: DUF192 domain-containing protein [Halobacteriota archaeon]|jgi:uncharacterized membrane protein (UPF0127 family)|nr:DUF192 domain-containing protein [Euryarchaeota archaeon]
MQIEYADGFWQQRRGLMFKKDIPEDCVLIFRFKKAQRLSVHTFFMRFNLDIGFLNEEDRITKIYKNVKPSKHVCSFGKCFFEMKAGGFDRVGFKEGMKI